jgi:hypothetical protein
VFSWRNWSNGDLALILLLTLIPVMPMFIYGYHWGHDLDIHLKSWMEAKAQFQQGILYPRWASEANYGYGEPRFIFYPPASWMLGGALGLFLPWRFVPTIYVWLTLILAALTMRKLAADWLPRRAALFTGLLYAVNPYMLVSAYTRCAYAEMLASAVFPLLLWGAFRIERDPRKSFVGIAISLGAIWLINLPAGVIASYSLACVLLVLFVLHRSVRPLLYGSAAGVTGIGLAAFSLLPAALERKWVNISAIARPNQLPAANFLFSPVGVPNMYVFNHGLSPLGVLMICAAVVSAIMAWRTRRSAPTVWWALAVLCGFAGFMMFRVSLPFWRVLPELRFVQFPWRWFFPLCAGTALLLAFAITQSRRKILWPAVVLAFVAIDAGIVHAREWFPYFADEIQKNFDSGTGYNGLDEYTPVTAPYGSRLADAPLVAVADAATHESGSLRVELWSPERKVINADLPVPTVINLKLLAYPAWQASVNGVPVPLEHNPETGQFMVTLPAGSSRAEVKFAQTWDRALGIIISVGSTAVLVGVWELLALRRKRVTEPRDIELAPAEAA